MSKVKSENLDEKNLGLLIKSILALIIVIGCGVCLFICEKNTIKKIQKEREDATLVTTVDANEVNLVNNGKLIHVSGIVKPSDTLVDMDFGIKVEAIHLKRSVEIYQWAEKTDENNSGTYVYMKEWKSGLTSHVGFHDTIGHINPRKIPFASKWLIAEDLKVGEFNLAPVFANKINKEEKLLLHPSDINIPVQGLKLEENEIYIGNGNMQKPQIGDIRISYSFIRPQMVSVTGKQKNNIIDTYITGTKKKINLLEFGEVEASEMFSDESKSEDYIGWILRIISIVLLFVGGLFLPKSIIKKVANINRLVFSILVTFIVSSMIIGFVKLSIEPLFGALLMGLSVMVSFIIIRKRKQTNLSSVY